MPVKNFSPELLKVFEAGAKKPFVFDCKTEKDAKKLRWRLHSLRREMRKERHWLTPVAEGVIISVNGTKLIAAPPDLEIESELKKALIEAGEIEMDGNGGKPIFPAVVSGIESYLNKGKTK